MHNSTTRKYCSRALITMNALSCFIKTSKLRKKFHEFSLTLERDLSVSRFKKLADSTHQHSSRQTFAEYSVIAVSTYCSIHFICGIELIIEMFRRVLAKRGQELSALGIFVGSQRSFRYLCQFFSLHRQEINLHSIRE